MTTPFENAIAKLSEIQRRAVEWERGALMVLAGPGSGKTQVLTCRIARLLEQSPEKQFRVLALTFTNKAADEMKTRVSAFVPGLEGRANICTFHGFCAQVLRQHGVHIGVEPTFAIYSDNTDREAVLEDALRRCGAESEPFGGNAALLKLIDGLKQRFITPGESIPTLARLHNRDTIVKIYRSYEQELRSLNALDFNSLIYDTYQLLTRFPAIASSYRRSHPYWLIDEFQDTNEAQYRLIRTLAAQDFKEVLAVADDDQIIYQWNGASFQQIQSFNNDFGAAVIQLPTNYRCPPAIVEAANRLVVYNAQRTAAKEPLVAAKTDLKYSPDKHLTVRAFETDADEADGVAEEIQARGTETWGETAVLARNKSLLDRMREALIRRDVESSIAQRRDDFLSAEVKWLTALLRQQVRPSDRRNMTAVVEAFNRAAACNVSAEQLLTEAEVTGQGYMAAWLAAVPMAELDPWHVALLDRAERLSQTPGDHKSISEDIVTLLSERRGTSNDLDEDLVAWREIRRDIALHLGKSAPLEQVLQELQLRSKEPSPKADSVTLMTIHGAKGREFDIVHVIGMVEEIIPSFQSRKKGDGSPEMEEERRNCFVAITRTKECLALSHAARYGTWSRRPSRFLVEMGLATIAD